MGKLKKKTDIQIQEAQSPERNPKRPTPSSIIIKMAKVKERILKAARDKQRIIYKGTPYKVVSCFFGRNMPLGSGMIYLKC